MVARERNLFNQHALWLHSTVDFSVQTLSKLVHIDIADLLRLSIEPICQVLKSHHYLVLGEGQQPVGALLGESVGDY